MKDGGLLLWNAIAICEMYKISWQMGEHLVGEPFQGSIIPFLAIVEYHLISTRDYQDFVNLARCRFEQKHVRFVERFHEVYSVERKNLPKDICCPERRLTKVQTTSRPGHVWPEVWTIIGKAAQNREKQAWTNKKPKLDSARRVRAIYFIDPDDQDYKDTLKREEKIWRDLWHKLCLAKGKFKRASRKWLQSRKLHLQRFQRRFLVVLWNLMNPQGKEWNLRRSHWVQRLYSDDPLQFGSHIYSYASTNEKSGCRNGKSSRQSQHGNWKKVKSKKQVILEAQRDKNKVHCASLMDICHLKNAELQPKLQRYKGRVVLRGDIAKDDSGAYAVSAEQGSSASHMTAAKVMDVVERSLDCDGQAPDSVSAYTQVKLEDASQIAQNSKVRMSR